MNLLDHARSMRGCHDRFDQIIALGNMPEGQSFNDLPEPERFERGTALAGSPTLVGGVR